MGEGYGGTRQFEWKHCAIVAGALSTSALAPRPRITDDAAKSLPPWGRCPEGADEVPRRRVSRLYSGRGAKRYVRGPHPSLPKNASIFRQIHLPHGGRLWGNAPFSPCVPVGALSASTLAPRPRITADAPQPPQGQSEITPACRVNKIPPHTTTGAAIHGWRPRSNQMPHRPTFARAFSLYRRSSACFRHQLKLSLPCSIAA